MFEESGPSGSDSSDPIVRVWDTASSATSAYFTSDRVAAIGATAAECVTSVSWIYSASLATSEITIVGAILAVTATMGAAGCIAFGFASTLSGDQSVAQVSSLVGYSTPLGLGFSVAGDIVGGQLYGEIGKDAGAALNDLIGIGSDSTDLLKGGGTWLTTPSLLGNDYSFYSDTRDLFKDLKSAETDSTYSSDDSSDPDNNPSDSSQAIQESPIYIPPPDSQNSGSNNAATSTTDDSSEDNGDDDEPDDGWDW